MTRAEQETIFRWAADEDMVSVWTAQPPVARKLIKAGYQPTRVIARQSRPGVEVGWFFSVPLAEFRWRVTRGKVRAPMSLERRQAAGDRLRLVRKEQESA